MAKDEKAKVQRWIRQGVASLHAVNTFLHDFEEYALRVKDPSLLAMTGTEAFELLRTIKLADDIHSGQVQLMLRERIRISEGQGAFSLQRKKEIREQRSTT